MKRTLGVVMLLVLFLVSCAKQREPVERILVRTAQVRALVQSVDGLEDRLRTKVEALGGFMTGSEHDELLTLSFRVPTAKLETALSEIEAMSKRVESRQVKGEDFTEEYVDSQSQLANLEATRERLRGLLERSSSVEEALKVNTALSDVQGQIEKLAGRTTYLKQAAALSSVTVSFVPEQSVAAWRPLEVATNSAHALGAIAQVLANLVIVTVVFSPLWAPVVWFVRRRRARAQG